MRILFVTGSSFVIEPLGVMSLVAVVRDMGHEADYAVLSRESMGHALRRFQPEIIAYSASSAEIRELTEADKTAQAYCRQTGRRIVRIMGGPHPTYSPDVVESLRLDAICQGEGERAMAEVIRRVESGASFDDIPNIAMGPEGAAKRELITDLDGLPFPDRAVLYRQLRSYRRVGLRSVMTGRGCPFTCSYCYNHVFRNMFKGCGPVLRRRSVENVLEELRRLQKDFPPLRLVRFADDTFALRADAWLAEFCERYPREIGTPFYCLMRPDTLTDETAQMLSEAGCQSIGMSIESGSEQVRSDILLRPLSNEVVREAFARAKRYHLNTYACTMLAIPGTSIDDDWQSLEFARSLNPEAPLFSICTPYRGTAIWRMCVERGYLREDEEVTPKLSGPSPLHLYSEAEKRLQRRMLQLGGIYCHLPSFLLPAFRGLLRLPIPNFACGIVGQGYIAARIAWKIFPQGIPRSLGSIARNILDTVRQFA